MSINSSIPFDRGLHDDNRGQGIVVLCAVFTTAIVLTTSTRIGIKLIDRVKLAVDDCLIMLGLVRTDSLILAPDTLSIVFQAFNLTCNIIEFPHVAAGFGRHLQFLTQDQVETVTKLSQMTILFAALAAWAVKISISFFILRLIRGTHKHLRWATYFLVTITSGSIVIQIILWSLQARPLEKLWKPEVPGTVAGKQMLVNSIYFYTCKLSSPAATLFTSLIRADVLYSQPYWLSRIFFMRCRLYTF